MKRGFYETVSTALGALAHIFGPHILAACSVWVEVTMTEADLWLGMPWPNATMIGHEKAEQ
ncbi:MAG: hypothetical protein AAFU78_11625 [Cyanobacteria bacterium J06633_2]